MKKLMNDWNLFLNTSNSNKMIITFLNFPPAMILSCPTNRVNSDSVEYQK